MNSNRSYSHYRAQQAHQPSPQQPQAAVALPKPGITYWLWRLADIKLLSDLSISWIDTILLTGNRQIRFFYRGALIILTVAMGFLDYIFDIAPTLTFGRNFSEWAIKTGAISEKFVSANILFAFVALFGILPTILELFSVGLALRGNLAVNYAIWGAILFDATTDAPSAVGFSKVIVNYFSQQAAWMQNAVVQNTLSVLLSAPCLCFATIMAEILFVSFLVATIHSLKTPRMTTYEPTD